MWEPRDAAHPRFASHLLGGGREVEGSKKKKKKKGSEPFIMLSPKHLLCKQTGHIVGKSVIRPVDLSTTCPLRLRRAPYIQLSLGCFHWEGVDSQVVDPLKTWVTAMQVYTCWLRSPFSLGLVTETWLCFICNSASVTHLHQSYTCWLFMFWI